MPDGAAVVDTAVGVGLGAAVVGAAVVGATVRIWVALGEGDAEGLALGEGEAEAPEKRERPPPRMSAINTSVRRPPATAARIRSIHRGPRRGGGMIFVVSDMGYSNRRLRAEQAYACADKFGWFVRPSAR